MLQGEDKYIRAYEGIYIDLCARSDGERIAHRRGERERERERERVRITRRGSTLYCTKWLVV